MSTLLTRLNQPVSLPPFILKRLKSIPVAQPFYLIIGAALAGVTAVFGAIFLVLVLIVLNFNPLGWTE